MGKIINTKSITNSSETNAPKFNFSEYSVGQVYHNNEHEIDFVTDNKSLYVCLVDTLQTSKENIEEQEGLLKIISQGEQGIQGQAGTNGAAGITPRIDAHFDGKQLIFSVDGKIKAVSPDLGGPSWRPVVNGTTLTWELSMDRYAPESIDLKQLRPISEHPIILRTNSDNTKYDWETSGPANYIQWKYEGDEYWNNLISISELMNLAVAGVCFWYDEETEEWHFGHKEIVKATYTADKNGRQIISNVELGDVLFDAGAVPMPDYSMEIDTIEQTIDEIKASLAGYATEEWVEGKGYLTGVDLDDYAKKSEIPSLADAYTKAESDAKYQPAGTYLTTHQPIKTLSGQSLIGSSDIPLKTINGESIIGTGNITVSVGDANLFDLTTRTVNGVRHLIKTVNGVETDLGEFTNGSSSGTGSFDVKIDNNYLYKSTDNGTTWTQVGPVNSDTEGCAKCWSEEEITALFANNTIADLRIVNNVLQKKVNGSWSDVGSVGGGTGTGCEECFTTSQIQQMIANALAGLDLDGIVRIADLDGYVKISDLSAYATKTYVEARIQDILAGETDVDYYRVFTLYQRTNSRTEVPNKPVTGNFEWNTSTGEIVLKSTFTSNWENHPQNATTDTPYLWMTSATFSYKSKSEVIPEGATNGWETPICLTGEPGSNGIAGEDGADGDSVEFIYILCTESEYNAIKNTTPQAEYGDGRSDDLPTYQTPSGNGWTDHPSGIDETYVIEAVSIRTKDAGVWSSYSKPTIWSMWGEDGMDGDGVEYIFCVTTQPSIATFITEIPITNEQVEALGSAYQVPDWTPYNGNWTDNPLDVDENQPYEWVAIRKYNGETGKWGPFSDPKVWGLWGQKTVYQAAESYYRPYMCYAFTRTNIDDFANQYTVVSPWEYEGVTYAQWIAEDSDRESDFYDNPLNYIVTLVRDAGGSYVDDNGRWSIATNIEWHDSIPTGTEQLYLINNLIGDEKDEETGWNGPTKWGDQAGFQTEYAASTPETDAVFAGSKVLPSLNSFVDDSPETIDEAAWRTVARTTGCGEWCDDNQISDPVYMATAYKKANGVWSDWTVSKIKGEKGNDGTDGTDGADGSGVEFVYFRTTDESEVPAVSDTYGTYDKETKVSENPDLDDFLPLVVASGFTPSDDTLTINGEYFWHDNPAGIDETFICEWVAIRFSAVSGSGKRVWGPFSVALWSKYGVNGRDGDGIEYVFHTSTNETAPTLNQNYGKAPNRNGTGVYELTNDYANRREWLPYAGSGTPSSVNDDFWTDDPSGVSASAPYEWVAVRKYNGELKEWEQFGPVALWAKFAFDGRDSDTREYVYLLADEKPSLFGEVSGNVLVDVTGQSSATISDVDNFNTDDYFPYAVVNGTRWNDHPEGVDSENKIEWYSFRDIVREKVNNEDVVTYGNFSEPIIWSQYGKTGRDGDGVQYIFTRTELYPFANQKDDPSQWDTTTAAYQSKYDEFLGPQSPYDWTDDPSGPTKTLPYEWVSMRKWRVTSESDPGSWSAYSTPSLWACYVEDSSTRDIITLDIDNSQQPFQVDENDKVVIGTNPIYLTTGTSNVLVKDDGTLLDWGKVYLGSINNNTVTWSSTPSITVNNYVASFDNSVTVTNGSATSSISNAYASQFRTYAFTLKTVFASNATVTDSVVIPVKVEDASGVYVGVDYLYLNPVHSEKLVNLNTNNLGATVIKKESKDAKTYNPSTIRWSGYVLYDSTYETVSKFNYSYTLDDGSRIVFDAIPTSDKNSNVLVGSKDYYFDKNGNILSGASAGFARLHLYNADDNQHEWDDWAAYMEIYLEYDNMLASIEDKITLGVGYDNEITDEEPIYVIYPGKDGVGLDSITHEYYYSASELTIAILETLPSSSWTTPRNDTNHKGEYVGIKTTTSYTNGTTEVEYSIEYVPNDGTDGASGTAIPYTFRGEWEENKLYYNNSQRVDIVKYSGNYYICTEQDTSSESFDVDYGQGKWEEFQGQYENIATGFLFAETGVIQNLKVAEVATNNSPNARITINEGGSGGTGRGNNAILGYSANSNEYGIEISGTELEDVFNMQGSTYFPNSETIEYHYDEQDDTGRTMYEGINASGTAYSEAIQDFYYDGTIDTTSIKITSAPDLTWTITENGTPITIEPSSALFLPDFDLVLFERNGSTYTPYATVGKYYWNDQGWTYNFGEVGFVKVTTSQNFYLGIVPTTRQWVGANYDGIFKSDGTSLNAGYCALTVTSAATNINYEYGTGQGHEGVTIAPNGILVYFDENNYFQFITINGTPQITLKKAGIDRLA